MKHILNKLSILLLLLLMAATTQAQQNRKFHVQSFEQNQFDTSARVKATEKYDGNGDRYSIIKVTSTNRDDDLMAYSFDFGMMNSLVEQHDDELWVYVQRNAKHVTIKRAGYATVRNYDLRTTIQPGQVFDMVLSPEAEKISRQMLLFKVSPSSSQAIITYKREGENDYKVFGNGNVDESGMAAMSLELGTYIYKIISQKYHPTEGRVVLNTSNGKHVEQVTLRPNFANVTLNTIDGADIYIDDAKKGTGSWTGTLTPGTYSLECRKESYKSSYQTITVEEGKDLTLQLDAPAPITGVLSMMSSPLDATIAVDGKDCGTTPLIIDDILVGKRKITVSKQGYTTATIDVIINEGETTEQSVTLEKAEVSSTVAANGVADGAITISKPRDPNELLCVACVNKNDGSIAYFTGAQWETLAADEKSQYAQLGVSIKQNGHEFIIAANDCNNGERLKFGGNGVDFEGVINHDRASVESQFINTGYSDTKAIVEQQRGKTDSSGIVGVPAAGAAWNYKANEYDKLQWYLPSISELEMIYNNKKDINSFFIKYIDGATETAYDSYWSSTVSGEVASWTVDMNFGWSSRTSRMNSDRVRAVSVVAANGVVNGAITISKPRDPNELLCVACANKADGSIAYFTGAQWETLAADEKSQYAQLGVSIKESGHEFIIAANDCNGGKELRFGGYRVDFEGVNKHNKKSVKSQFINTGYSDTKAMIEQQRGKKDSEGIIGVLAAEAAWNYKANEYDKQQWYLPSVSELEMIYKNKRAINEFLSKYIDGATEIWNDWYWSSTEYNEVTSWYVHMNKGGSKHLNNRHYSFRVRAVAVVK